jgi:hypothetical protein
VLQFRLDAKLTDNGEELAKMELLAFVRDIEDLGGVPAFDSIQQRGDVGGRVVEPPIALLDDERRQALFLQEHHPGALAPSCDSFSLQAIDEGLKTIVVEALAEGDIERNPEAFIDLPELPQGGLDKCLPEPSILRFSLLQANELPPCLLHLGRVLLGPPVTLDIDPLEFFQRVLLKGLRVSETAVPDKENAELRPPVPDMVVRDDFKPEKPVDPVQRKTQNGRSDVADMHRFGHVRAGEVDHDGLSPSRPLHTDPLVLKDLLDPVAEPGAGKPQIHEAGPRHFRPVQPGHPLQPRSQLMGKLPRIFPHLLRERHGAVELVITKSGVRCRIDSQTSRIQNRCAKLLFDNLQNRVGKQVNDRCHRFS